MKKGWKLLFIVTVCMVTVGCYQTPARYKTDIIETSAFDLDEATNILKETESVIVDLITAKGGSRTDLQSKFKAVYGEESEEVLKLFFADYRNSGEKDLRLLEDFNFFPTIYHEGIEITDAYIEKRYDRDTGKLFSEYLCIEEKFVGDIEKYVHLKKFSKENYFEEDTDGNWRFHHFSGDVNISNGGAYYLDFK